jgi:aryl-alcohol dehydrogenase-like predicted oxidoreductase
MRTDYVDLLQLHSCGIDVLEKGEAIEAILKAKQAGLTRFIGYSGDNDAARWAVESGHFDTLQTSFSLVDQQARTKLFPLVEAKGMGLIAKRPIANGTWGAAQSPSAYAEPYFQRAQAMASIGAIPGAPADRILLALGFVLAHPEVDTAIVGTRNPAHMSSNLRLVERRSAVSVKVVEELHRRFDQVGQEWGQKG